MSILAWGLIVFALGTLFGVIIVVPLFGFLKAWAKRTFPG